MYRVSFTSSASRGICRSELSKIRLTWQESAAFLSFPPFQIRSVSLPARIAFALFGPRTNRMASAMLLFPEPLGPVMDVYPCRNGTEIFRPNDLKFSIWISFRNKASPDRWKVSAGKHRYYPSHLYPSGVRRESDGNAEGDDGYKSIAGCVSELTNEMGYSQGRKNYVGRCGARPQETSQSRILPSPLRRRSPPCISSRFRRAAICTLSGSRTRFGNAGTM